VDNEHFMVLCSGFRAQEIPINCISSVAGTSEALIMGTNIYATGCYPKESN
jgi:hypothetical protein